MITVTFNDTAATALLRQQEERLRSSLPKLSGNELRSALVQHFRQKDKAQPNKIGGKRDHYWNKVADSIAQPAYRTGTVTLSILHPGLALRLYGSTVTANRAAHLTIPISPISYGVRAADLANRLNIHLFRPRKKGGALSNILAGLVGGRLIGLYALVKSARISADPTALPTEATLTSHLQDKLTTFINKTPLLPLHMKPHLLHSILTCQLPLGHALPLPLDIQWCPPGTHTVSALLNDQPATVTVHSDPATALRLNAQLQEMLQRAERGQGVKPFIDFDHQGGVAAAWPAEIYWGGNDPKNGGIRLKLSSWSQAGEAAILGRNYQAFSPTLLRSTTGNEITGIQLNLGGLVNNPAFQSIQTFFANGGESGAESAAPQPPTPTHTMNKLLAQLHTLGLIQDGAATEELAIAQVTAAHAALQSEIDRLTAANTELTTQLQQATTTAVQARKTCAEQIVNAAIASGKIPGKNEQLKARWIKSITEDASNAELLEALPQSNLTTPLVNTFAASTPAAQAELLTGSQAAAALLKKDPAVQAIICKQA